MRTGKCETCSEWSQCRGGAFHLRELGREDAKLCHFHDIELEKFDNRAP